MIDEKKLIEEFKKIPDRDWYTPWIVDVINEQPKVNYPLSDCVGDCKSCWKTKLVNPQWIPCSERLPSESGKYFATGIKGSVYIAEFSKGVINGKPVSLWCRSGGHYCNVIAWMELPPAYERRNEDD